MDCCSSPCTESSQPTYNQEINAGAEQLATLLAQTDEYQEFVRLSGLINLDPEVKQILSEMRSQQMTDDPSQEETLEDLQTRLEALPAVQAYRKVETALKDLFRAADQTISAAVGVEFAPNALPRACG
ncbi:MAG TPA: YlbF family regulator [Anaerolineaceae bacterium]|nr:YlbF family regulator [Anaerolineaceae bacterium]